MSREPSSFAYGAKVRCTILRERPKSSLREKRISPLLATQFLGAAAVASAVALATTANAAAESQAYALGFNSSGRTGMGTTSGFTLVSTPIDGTNLAGKNIIRASAGEHSLVLADDGSVFSFGSNDFGKTGLNTLTGNTLIATPINTTNLGAKTIINIAAGDSSNLLLADDGTIFGFGASGALGYSGGAILIATPIDLGRLSGKQITDLSVGYAHSLIVARVPEPASLTLFGLAVAAIAALRRRSRLRRHLVPTTPLVGPESDAVHRYSTTGGSGGRKTQSKFYICLAELPCLHAASFNPAAGASFRGMGGEESIANAVSGDGSTAVGADWTIFGHEAFQWTNPGGLQFIGDLPGGALGSLANAASSDGSAVVGMGIVGSGSNYEACLWTSSGIQSLGDFDGGNLKSEAYGVSGDGSIVVGYGTSSQGRQAFRHTMAGGLQGLGDFSGGAFESVAYGISGDGATIVGYGTSSQGSEAFLWTSAGGMQGIGDLAGGAFGSSARGVSGDGSVIIGMGTSDSGTEAFRWTSTGGMQGLGDLSGGSYSSVATAVSADGLTVVGTSLTSQGPEAFIWDVANGMRNLREVLTYDYRLDLEGWVLHSANGISADGRTIVGDGLNPNGGFEAWIAVLAGSAPALQGDFNGDQKVDAADYVVWRKQGGTPAAYAAWRASFGHASGNGPGFTGNSPGSVPEPCGLFLLQISLSFALLRRGPGK